MTGILTFPEDYSAKARVVASGLEFFGKHGFENTSLRLLASRAKVSVGLVSHHFGSKAGLREFIDERIRQALEASVHAVPASDDTVERLLKRLAAVPAADTATGLYLARSFQGVQEHGLTVFHVHIRDVIRRALAGLQLVGRLRPVTDLNWQATNAMLMMFAIPALREPVAANAADQFAARVEASIALLCGGLAP